MTEQGSVIAPGNVAVVTGAASGIGFALARRCAQESMKVVIADVESGPLGQAHAALTADGHDVTACVTDVSDASQVDALRDAVLDRFGAVHLLCNNAGVGSSDEPMWTMRKAQWDWVFTVNVEGVLNGIRAFVPTMIEQTAAHVVNTSSAFGLFAGCRGPYGVSKHTVVALSETLHFQLAAAHPNVGVSVLCPGAVRTNITTSDRNRPVAADSRDGAPVPTSAEIAALDAMIQTGKDPADVADMVLHAVRARRFYVLTHTNRFEAITNRAADIIDGRAPRHPLA